MLAENLHLMYVFNTLSTTYADEPKKKCTSQICLTVGLINKLYTPVTNVGNKVGNHTYHDVDYTSYKLQVGTYNYNVALIASEGWHEKLNRI